MNLKETEETKINKREGERKMKNFKGITLIALVVTIVVLLILAGVSIGMLAGENGIIRQAIQAKANTRGAEVKETVDMAVNENKMLDYSNTTGTKKTRQEVIEKLQNEGKLTDKEVEQLQTVDKITIGEIEVDFSGLNEEEGTTIGDIYSDELVGTEIKNTTLDSKLPEGTDNSWIILGKDKDGSIMLTTSKPISNGATLTDSDWLSYEEDLNTACSIYGGIIQGQEIKSRCMTIDDVNMVTGFVEPEFNTYTFTNEATNDYENKRVNYWHPDENGTATESDGTGDPNLWSKNETTYECDAYEYYIDTSSNTVKYVYEGSNGIETYTTPLKNTNLIFGDNLDYWYVLASRSTAITPTDAYFFISFVSAGKVARGNMLAGDFLMCSSNSSSFEGGKLSAALPIRPIINLPSNIKVEELSGEWTIIE